MGAMNFTKEQEMAIYLRDSDLLVSAGAGAGKTRVLVNRMAEMILDKEHPLPVDAFLVMTFTNAAAEEMRERITEELNRRLEQEPGNRRLRRQIRGMKHADISTVHSFCNRLIRTHFNEADMDPSFRIGEEGELFLLRQKAMEDVLEEAYAAARPSFLRFVEAYAPGKSDHMIEELVEELYHFSRGFPDKDSWFKRLSEETAQMGSVEGIKHSRAMQAVMEKTERVLRGCLSRIREGLDCFKKEEGAERFRLLLEEDERMVNRLLASEDFDDLCEKAAVLQIPDLPRARKEEKEWPYLEEVKERHKQIREEIARVKESFFLNDTDGICRENRELQPFLEELIALTSRYEELYFQSKKEKNVFDFDDLEHIALRLLVDSYDEAGNPNPSETARVLSEKYKAVFVDEYQDTNLVQETILRAICREGKNHLFVVGDVKQSIYRFRQARPDLFLARYDRYPEPDERTEPGKDGEEEGIRIELRDNFRSAPGVLDFCNRVFRNLMDKQFGGVDYTEKIALHPGENGPMAKDTEQSEMLLLVEDDEKEQMTEELNAVQAETVMIAGRIRELLEEGYSYRDMVILLRSGSGRAESMAEILRQCGIPAVSENKTGYFQTREVQLVLNYLAVVDNVYQDIPMAAVLLSSIGGLTEEELASLRILTTIPARKDYAFFDLIEMYLSEGEDPVLKEKLSRFMELLLYFRKKKKETPLHELLWEIYNKTGIFYQIQMMPGGETRKENLLMLLKKAEDYEKTVFKGLFYFLRYMEQLRTYQIEMGGASFQEETDTVRIMTIHKSKGLEFPVVFVSGLFRKFNLTDGNRPVLLHPEMGVGMEYVDLASRIHHPSLLKKAIREQMIRETLEEELRILYVAMTRAQRKLILTGMAKPEAIEEAEKIRSGTGKPMETPAGTSGTETTGSGGVRRKPDLEKKLSARSFMDWILLILPELPVKKIHFHQLEEVLPEKAEYGEKGSPEWMSDEEMASMDLSLLEHAFSWKYPYGEAVSRKRKYAVSELKKISMLSPDGDGYGEDVYDETLTVRSQGQSARTEPEGLPERKGEDLPEETEILKPDFLREEKKEAAGMARGTIIHKIMELLPFGEIHSGKELFEALRRIEETYPSCSRVSMKAVYRGLERFLFSPVGEKIRKMDQAHRLRKELPFTVGVTPAFFERLSQWESAPKQPSPVTEAYMDRDPERIIVQGVIDACGEDEEGLWLLDYKTDYVRAGEEEKLLDRYKIQMLYYKTALEQITHKKVAHSYIFSFSLGKYLEVRYGEEETPPV